MWNIKEEDLDEFKITCRNRLSPERSMVFILGAMFYSSLFMLFIFGALVKFGWGYYPNLFDKIIVCIELVLYTLQVIFLILYLFPKVRFKCQKLQALVILLCTFQLGTIGFTLFILPAISNYSINQITLFMWVYCFRSSFCSLMYAVAIGAAEFQLLVYCRFKFPSFYISWEEHEKERQKRLKLYEEQEKRKPKK
ncbi:Hypothetical protein ACI5QN_01929 [Bacillus cereus]|uniref:hypothetical protein n=1 Tax=Bacillus cereus TaxID=1396 RepID=UPI003D3427F7